MVKGITTQELDKLMSMERERVEWVALSMVARVGAVLMRRLLDHFATPREVLTAKQTELLKVAGVGNAVARQILAVDVGRTAYLLDQWQSQNIRILTWQDNDYPTMLKNLDDAPPTLFMRGDWSTNHTRNIAIVGTRESSGLARDVATQLAEFFAEKGWTIVSGLALGIDNCAHLGALAAPNGQTVAVLGSGVNNIYPPSNRKLIPRILSRGALFSEAAPSAEPHSIQLVARNRIITGLSQAVIVVEAGAQSGALHAARFAKSQGRLVCAVDMIAEGNVQLVRDGAFLLMHDFSNMEAFVDTLIS